MKKLVFLFAIFTFTVSFAVAQDAASIVQRSRDRINANTTQTRSSMIITARDGTTTERIIDQYSKDDAQGRTRTVIVFQSPATVRNTRFLILENTNGKNDQWIFLPQLGRVRRVAASESGGSFMGTDLSYDDMNFLSRNADEDTHTMLREENLNGADCYVIQSIPKDSSYQYGKVISWIDKANSVLWKSEFYDHNGKLAKTLECSQLEENQGYLNPRVMRFATPDKGTATTVTSQIVKYDDPIPEGVFTTQYIETGRAR
jgi:outer membrane lipoprotein-sorting protein